MGSFALADSHEPVNDKAGIRLLEQMSMAAETLDYTGQFVYVKDGKITGLKIAHIGAVNGAGSQQKLMALDGSMREIIQQDDLVACVLPDQGMGLREQRQAPRMLFNFNASGLLENIDKHYEISLKGADRVADRDCEKLAISPRDEYRYGYNLCIDKQNQLLLDSELTDLDGTVLESYKFIGVNFDKVDVSQIRSETPPKTLNWMDDKPVQTTVEMKPEEGNKKWRVAANPSDFVLEHYIERISPVMQAKIKHLVLGDGLAQVSVFISPASASANQSNATLNMGSLHSFTRTIDNHIITVIGEVPLATVTLIAERTESY